MALSVASRLSKILLQDGSIGLLAPIVSNTNLQIVRHRKTKHWNPKWKTLRRLKVIKVDLPNLNERSEDLSEEQIRSKMKERGILPPRPWNEIPLTISSTGGAFEPYVPPEGDGKVSSITAQGAKQKLQFLEKKTKTMMAIRKVRSYEEDFDTPLFCKQAEEIYIKAHNCLVTKDKDEVIKYVTEKAFPEIFHDIERKTIHWKFLKAIELPRIVHARCTDIISKENLFGQITVRFHTQQVLAIYDRFGRLMHGSEIIAKDVLEYVVFEKHLANEYGTWRIHHKIIPDWLPPREPREITYRKIEPPAESAVSDLTETDSKNAQGSQTLPASPVAVA